MSRNIVEIEAKQEIDGQKAFEATFAPTPVHEIILEMEERHRGPPICVLRGDDGKTLEVHPNPLRGREGRYSSLLEKSDAKYTSIRITTARDIIARLVKVKLIGGAHVPAAGAGPAGPAHV